MAAAAVALAAGVAANVLRAEKLQTKQEREFDSAYSVLKVMPLLAEGANWSDYRRQMQRFAYTYGWAAGLMNRDVAGAP